MSQIESGHNGALVSLGGVVGAPGRGRITNTILVIAGTTTSLLMSDNSKRISAIIQNIGPTAVSLMDGLGSLNVTQIVMLSPGQSLQIDNDFPWTGPVYTTGGNIYGYEISVP